MAEDARFEDGGESPLRLIAETAEDLEVISTLAQDAVFPITEMRYETGRRRFSLLLNRFRWEDKAAAERRGRDFERVQSVLSVSDALKVQSQGIDRKDDETILSLLSITFDAGDDGTGRLILNLAGDGAIGIDVEAINLTLQDVTRPYRANAGKAPEHGA